jgi:magnesium-transporting ATPase (P-type)
MILSVIFNHLLEGVIFLNITSMSLSYIFLGISIITFIFFFYYKYLVVNTGDKSEKRGKIIGSMKDPEDWRGRNNKMAYVSLFWTIISIIVFIYLKFFFQAGLISIIYVFVYLVAVVLSVSLFLKQNKVVGSK